MERFPPSSVEHSVERFSARHSPSFSPSPVRINSTGALSWLPFRARIRVPVRLPLVIDRPDPLVGMASWMSSRALLALHPSCATTASTTKLTGHLSEGSPRRSLPPLRRDHRRSVRRRTSRGAPGEYQTALLGKITLRQVIAWSMRQQHGPHGCPPY